MGISEASGIPVGGNPFKFKDVKYIGTTLGHTLLADGTELSTYNISNGIGSKAKPVSADGFLQLVGKDDGISPPVICIWKASDSFEGVVADVVSLNVNGDDMPPVQLVFFAKKISIYSVDFGEELDSKEVTDLFPDEEIVEAGKVGGSIRFRTSFGNLYSVSGSGTQIKEITFIDDMCINLNGLKFNFSYILNDNGSYHKFLPSAPVEDSDYIDAKEVRLNRPSTYYGVMFPSQIFSNDKSVEESYKQTILSNAFIAYRRLDPNNEFMNIWDVYDGNIVHTINPAKSYGTWLIDISVTFLRMMTTVTGAILGAAFHLLFKLMGKAYLKFQEMPTSNFYNILLKQGLTGLNAIEKMTVTTDKNGVQDLEGIKKEGGSNIFNVINRHIPSSGGSATNPVCTSANPFELILDPTVFYLCTNWNGKDYRGGKTELRDNIFYQSKSANSYIFPKCEGTYGGIYLVSNSKNYIDIEKDL